jgi:hypothetical protein
LSTHRNFAIITLSARIALGAAFAMSPLAMAVAATVTSNSVTSSGNIGMTSSTFTGNQYAGSVTLSAQRTGGTTGAVSVTYVTVPESAHAGVQYTSETGTLSWAAGDATNKTFTVPLATSPAFTGTLSFAVRLTAGSGTQLGAHTSALVSIVGGTTPPPITKSIKQWVSCSDTIDETAQLASALQAAANNAFTLIVDCPVRLHTGTAAASSIAVPDGVTLEFQGAGEFLAVSNGPPALTVANPSQVTFINWNYTYL